MESTLILPELNFAWADTDCRVLKSDVVTATLTDGTKLTGYFRVMEEFKPVSTVFVVSNEEDDGLNGDTIELNEIEDYEKQE